MAQSDEAPTHAESQDPDAERSVGEPASDVTLRDTGGTRRAGAPLIGAALPGVGEEFAGFSVRERIGGGGMGNVYRARDGTGRDVALKVVRPDSADEEGVTRFLREGESMASVPPHGNVITVHTAGEERGLPYLVLDLVEGEDLAKVLRPGPLEIERAVTIAGKMARALQHIHRAGVIHRDLKPANILIRAEDSEPLLGDFGMASMAGSERLTRTGDLIGTPLYMSPEQVLGRHREVDGRTDVWALGVVFYEMLAGRPPFRAKSLVELARLISQEEPPPLEGFRPEVDGELVGIVERALARKPQDRYQDPGEVADALREWRRRGTEARTPPTRSRFTPAQLQTAAWVAASLLLAIGLFLGVQLGILQRDADKADPGVGWNARRDLLAREARAMVPDLLGPGESGKLRGLNDIVLRGAALREQASKAGYAVDLDAVQALVERGRFERAMLAGRHEEAQAAIGALGIAPESHVLQARLDIARGKNPADALHMATSTGGREVLKAAAVLAERVELLKAAEALQPSRVKKALTKVGDSVLIGRARQRAIEKGLEQTTTDGLVGVLGVLALLKGDEPPEDGEAGARMAEWVFTRALDLEQEAATGSDSDRADRIKLVVGLLIGVGESGLRPQHLESAARLLHLVFKFDFGRGLVSKDELLRIDLAMVKADVRLQRTHLEEKKIAMSGFYEVRADPAAVYLQQLVRLAQGGAQPKVQRQLLELVSTNKGGLLGPRHRARGLVEACGPHLSRAEQKRILTDAVRLDPDSPWARMAYARFLAEDLDAEGAAKACTEALRVFPKAYPGELQKTWDEVLLLRAVLTVHARAGDRDRVEQVKQDLLVHRSRFEEDWYGRLVEEVRGLLETSDQQRAREEERARAEEEAGGE